MLVGGIMTTMAFSHLDAIKAEVSILPAEHPRKLGVWTQSLD